MRIVKIGTIPHKLRKEYFHTCTQCNTEYAFTLTDFDISLDWDCNQLFHTKCPLCFSKQKVPYNETVS